ncbi:MAG: efflux RND transporter periplasmic adaptor subunit [Bacteroidetes bacterium]|nr:MAG: efflux RND transporter periplasmic adaptor subunit [Bacteroidota bacterium]
MKNIAIKICLLATIFMLSCTKKHEKEKEDIYEVTSPLRKDTSTTREYVCQIKAIQHIELRALDRGYLQEIFVDEGKFVKKGTLMFQILPVKYQAELEKAKAEANYAQIEFQNSKLLADSNVISPNQLALVKAKYEKAKAELRLAEVYMSFTRITAPFDGLIDRFQVRLGSLLDDGDLLTTLSDISELWVYFNVPEAEYLDYKQGEKDNNRRKVRLKMANNQLYEYEGVIKTIEADFNNMTGNIAFRATFPNPDALLRHGETGNVIVTVPLKKALMIPQKATFEVLDQKFVYVLDKDNVLQTRRITVSAEMPDIYIVKDGISENDKILLEGLRKVKEGQKIQYHFKEPKIVMANLKLHAE